MLELHRASAGSGKTYTLAKKYIWYLITIKPDGDSNAIRLRTDAELRDSARHILAMTFTNKATNEMQLRIVDRLFDIGYRNPVIKTSADGSLHIKKPAYLEDFIKEITHSGCLEKIANLENMIAEFSAVCKKALTVVLENYSEFNVSTIDSFFQIVLRTLAYETDLNDSYQVELDSDFLSQVSVDGTLEQIDSPTTGSDVPFWIDVLMKRSNQGWSIFRREIDPDVRFATPYKSFVESVKKLENEEYKKIRGDVEKWFSTNPDIVRLYKDLELTFETRVNEALHALKSAARKAWRALPQELISVEKARDLKSVLSRLNSLADAKIKKWSTKNWNDFKKFLLPEFIQKKSVSKYLDEYPGVKDSLAAHLAKIQQAINRYEEEQNEPAYKHWRLYATNLPYLALLDIITGIRREYLEETNAIELSETSTILREIISDSDTPFVYERIGTRLNHFLIDEFQDTSRLQWENLRPLIVESLSRNNDNLIIGDAKQSIYRFRNADPSLISSIVPEDRDILNHGLITRGDKISGNTNYRSALRVIQFNNSFFEYLAGKLDEVSDKQAKSLMKFVPLYSNVVQNPADHKEEGYVEVTISKGDSNQFKKWITGQLPLLVREILGRGYRQKDIAVLVDTHLQGESVINAFVDYNNNIENEKDKIRFVSEQSLKIANSKAVKTIVGVLESMARGLNPRINEGEDRIKKGVANWKDISSDFKFFSLNYGTGDMAETLEQFLNTKINTSSLRDLLTDIQTFSIPAIVESVIDKLIPEELRHTDAVFISAFQDIVLEYCERNSTDLGSFLHWWERKKGKATIASPEETDAVRVLTIHKSKGLEYNCVIIPFVDFDMSEKSSSLKSEWRWVKPEIVSHPEIRMPDYIPINTTPELEGTVHEHLLYEYRDMVKMDLLNKAYVAFTRASRELYIFAFGSDKSDLSDNMPGYSMAGNYLEDFLKNGSTETKGNDISRLHSDSIREQDEQDDYIKYQVGDKVEDERKRLREQDAEKKKDDNDGAEDGIPTEMITIGDYLSIIPSSDMLKFRDTTIADYPEEEDPREEGTKRHAVMENVVISEDLHKAVRNQVIAGMLTPEEGEAIESHLSLKLALPQVKRWFDGSARVITERAFLIDGMVSDRPDRILIYPDGHAEIVDYKFGHRDEDEKSSKSYHYRRQIRNYVNNLTATGAFTRIEGYLWYVNEDVIECVIVK